VTHHSARIGGQQINYTADRGNVHREKRDDGTPKARLLFLSPISRTDVTDASKRPLSIVLQRRNPGSGSLFTHMGLGSQAYPA